MPNPSAPPYEIKRTLGFLVLRSQRLMSLQLESLFAKIGLNVQQHVALQLLYEGLAGCPSDIAKTLGLDTGTTTRLADQLADKGLVVRKRDDNDRRSVGLVLTEEGISACQAAQAVARDYMQGLLDGFDPAEAETFLAYLARLVSRLEEPADA